MAIGRPHGISRKGKSILYFVIFILKVCHAQFNGFGNMFGNQEGMGPQMQQQQPMQGFGGFGNFGGNGGIQMANPQQGQPTNINPPT